MSKKQIVKIAGIASAVIFAMGALFPILSIDFLGTSMSKSLIDTADWIFVMLNAVLIIVNVLLSEEISLDICALTAIFITIGELRPFFDGSLGEASSFVKKGFGFYCLLIGTILIVIVAVAHWFIKPSKGKSKKSKKAENRKCPYCAETIKADALICRFCGSKLDLLPEPEPESTANDEADNSWKGVAKAGGQLLFTVAMIFISLALCGFVIACVLVSSSGQEEQPDNSSQISESYYSEPDTEEVQPAETEVTTAATTTTPATTTTAATTTTTAATTPEPEVTSGDDIIFMSQIYDMVEPEIKAYISINFTTKRFYFGSSDYYKISEYRGSWEYVDGPKGYDTLLCTIKADEHGEDMGDKYQFILNISWDDPDTAYFTLNCDYDYDIFGSTRDGAQFQIYR